MISEGNIPYHFSFSCEPIVFCIVMMLLLNDSWKKNEFLFYTLYNQLKF